LQLLHMDVAKVDRDAAYFASIFSVTLQAFWKNIFQTYVASSDLSGCCICFTHMLQVFYLDVVYVLHTCCKCLI
jgi:hypothetical protein